MKTSITEYLGCGFSFLLTAVQTQQTFQIISLILTCLATAATLAFTIYKWYKAAKEDGKIDDKELEQGINILKNGIEELSDKLNDKGDK